MVFGELGVVIVLVPDACVQTPVPTMGVFPLIVKLGDVIHKEELGAAIDAVGKLST